MRLILTAHDYRIQIQRVFELRIVDSHYSLTESNWNYYIYIHFGYGHALKFKTVLNCETNFLLCALARHEPFVISLCVWRAICLLSLFLANFLCGARDFLLLIHLTHNTRYSLRTVNTINFVLKWRVAVQKLKLRGSWSTRFDAYSRRLACGIRRLSLLLIFLTRRHLVNTFIVTELHAHSAEHRHEP